MELPPYGPEPYASANSAMPAYLVDGDGFACLRAVRDGSDRPLDGHSLPSFEAFPPIYQIQTPANGDLDLVDGDGFEPS